jgi:2OG-Fe(II) oxygenase superfamily
MIIVKDDFFTADLANLVAKGTETFQWRYHHKSDVNNPTDNKFFVSHLWTHSSEHNLFHMLWKLIHNEVPSIQDYYCWRIIANGQVKGQNGNWHTDHGDKTVLYYPTAWNPEWGGSTYFKIDNSEKEIQYKKNRLVVFDSAILHYGSCPTVENVFRVSIAFNLRQKSLIGFSAGGSAQR